MKILVVSDSHGDNMSLYKLSKMYNNIDIYIHCGDSESDEFSIDPFRSVKGNCDYLFDFPDHLLIPTPYGNIYVQHHPLYSLDKIKKNNAKIFIHGHTHIRKNETQDNILILNPGALSFARDGNDLSYMILDIDEHNVKVTFKTLG